MFVLPTLRPRKMVARLTLFVLGEGVGVDHPLRVAIGTSLRGPWQLLHPGDSLQLVLRCVARCRPRLSVAASRQAGRTRVGRDKCRAASGRSQTAQCRQLTHHASVFVAPHPGDVLLQKRHVKFVSPIVHRPLTL